MPPGPWRTLKSSYLVEKPWLKLREDTVKTPSGTVLDEFHVLESPDWACICCVSTEKELVLIRQYRHGAARVTLELPAGVIDPHELPLDGARRELREETGFTATRWQTLPSLDPEPSRNSHRAHCFVALGATRTHEQVLDASEEVEVVMVPVSDLGTLIEGGALDHGVHVAALMLAKSRGLL